MSLLRCSFCRTYPSNETVFLLIPLLDNASQRMLISIGVNATTTYLLVILDRPVLGLTWRLLSCDAV